MMQENDIDSSKLYATVLRLCDHVPATTEDIEFFERHPAAVREVRMNILHDRHRAANREATRELFPGDKTRLDNVQASDATIESGLSGRARGCTIDEIPALKEELGSKIETMEVTTNNGRPLSVRFGRK